VNRANVPGFTAHASLYRTGVIYAAEGGIARSGNDVIAQKSRATEAWYARCQARCVGSYIGSLGGIDLGNCYSDCDFLYSVIEN